MQKIQRRDRRCSQLLAGELKQKC